MLGAIFFFVSQGKPTKINMSYGLSNKYGEILPMLKSVQEETGDNILSGDYCPK